MPLYTLIVQDNFGVKQPVGFFFVREETEALIAARLKYFCNVRIICIEQNIFQLTFFSFENNDNSITEVFLTDKDCG